MKTIEITSEGLQQIIEDYGHHMNITIPFNGDREIENRVVLNDGMVYNPFGKKSHQYGLSNNEENAKNAMKFITEECTITSSVFNSVRGRYVIID